MNRPIIRIVATDGKAYPVAPAGVSSPSPIVGTPATPITATDALANNSVRDTGAAGCSPVPVAPTLIMHDGHAYDPKRHGTKPCLECLRGEAGCICGVPEPEQECFVPGLNRDPDLHTQAMQSREAY